MEGGWLGEVGEVREVGCMIGRMEGGWEKLGKSKKGCNQRGRQHLGKGMSDEY